MSKINKITKTSSDAVKIDYTSRDYATILDDLINSIPGITNRWNSTDVNDPGMILVKLMAILGDMLMYNQDMQSLEIYPNSVTQRKNATSIYKLIGYKMRWYKSATLIANIVNTYSSGATMPRFCTFSTINNDITYCTFETKELRSNTTNNGEEELVELIQGIPVTPVRTSNSPYPQAGSPWHSIYGFNYTTDDIINNRIYLKDKNIDQEHIIVVDNNNEEWTIKENIYLTTDVGKFFEFGVDVNDTPYLELVDYYKNFNISKFKIFYIKSAGESGQIYANTLKNITGNVWARSGNALESSIYNVNNFIHFTHYDSTPGYDPETPDEARKNSVVYQNTLDTLITLSDFEKATLRERGVANVRATDLTNDPGVVVTFPVGDINQDGYIDASDMQLLENYLADPNSYPLTVYQKRLADATQNGVVDQQDLACFRNYLNPVMWKIGDINQDDEITSTDLQLLRSYIDDPLGAQFTETQIRLCDINQDGEVDETDYQLLSDYLDEENPESLGYIIEGDSGYIGTQTIRNVSQLNSFVVKLYILRNEIGESDPDDVFTSMIQTDLQQYKILPLTIEVDLHSIAQYYWTVTGVFFTKEPLTRDELQTIIVNINNELRYKYSVEKVNFNTTINYKEVIETILSVDSRILMVDLDPIVYKNTENEPITKEQLTGSYTHIVTRLQNPNPANNLRYQITLPQVPILPGSVMLRINNGQYTLRDNNNGNILNIDNILVRKGTIDYITGQIDITFNSEVTSDIQITYVHNQTTIAKYKNLSTQTFYYDPSSLQKDDMQDLI